MIYLHLRLFFIVSVDMPFTKVMLAIEFFY